MPASLQSLMEAANSAVPRISPEEAKSMVDSGEAVIVDVRDGAEVAKTGKAAGALHISRGLLEFKADPDAPSHEPRLARDKAVILYCGSGGRAALAGKTLQDFGYEKVYNLGGFTDWANAGLPVED
ncbi:MAG: rhodanese-like domain-containing protein [Pseudomonadota bacterium]|nr:rhodanese-like domain-containing protein [Pseudomonadota bacterium]